MRRAVTIKYNLYGVSKKEQINVIYNDNNISYYDEDVKTSVSLDKGIIIRDNNEYSYTIDLSKNFINIHLKKENIDLEIKINILEKKHDSKYLYVKYLLVDENVINEYEIKL